MTNVWCVMERNDLEKIATNLLILNDAETIISLIESEHDPYFCTMALPYYALFVQSCQEYYGEVFTEEKAARKIKSIRNFIKAYGDRASKIRKRVKKTDSSQDEIFASRLKLSFMKRLKRHYNIGVLFDDSRHIVSNTQLIADFLELEDLGDSHNEEKQIALAAQISATVAAIRNELSKYTDALYIQRPNKGIGIPYFYDFNTGKRGTLFDNGYDKYTNIAYLNLLSMINFVSYCLRPLLDEENPWIFRIEYIITYYVHKALSSINNHYKSNSIEPQEVVLLESLLSDSEDLFKTAIRNCMMHYGLEDQGIISKENIDKPLFGIIETSTGRSYHDYYKEFRLYADSISAYLDNRFSTEKLKLQLL